MRVLIGGMSLIFSACTTVSYVVMNSITNQHLNFSTVWTDEEFGLKAEHFFLKTHDGLHISAYEVAVDTPEAVVICLSGIHNPSATIYFGHARLFKEHNFATILFDMRARGESDGNRIYVGYREWLDVKTVVDYIKEKPQYDNVPIVVMGLSLGGAIAINATGKIADIDGLISLSAFSSWERAFYDGMAATVPKMAAVCFKPSISMASFLKFGFNTCSIKPGKQIRNLGNRPALLMHSKGDTQVAFRNFEILLKNAPPHVETFIRDGDLHLMTEIFENPEKDKEYSEKIIQFIKKHFVE